jgi:hypothetical protein
MGHASLMDVDDLTPLTLGRLKHRIQVLIFFFIYISYDHREEN